MVRRDQRRGSCGTVPVFVRRTEPAGRGTVLRDAEAILDLPGIETIEHYPFVLAAAGGAAMLHGMFDRAEQLCQEALDAGGEPNDELAASRS